MKNHTSQICKSAVTMAFAAIVLVSPMAQAKSYAAHNAEITRLAEANQAGQLTIGRGDAISIIAQRYATANGVPFEVSLKGLIAANPDAFEDAQHNLKVGATLIVPLKADIAKASAGEAITAPAAAAPTAPVAPDAKSTANLSVAVTPAAPPVISEQSATPSVPVKTESTTPATASQMTVEPWAWCLLAILALMGLIGWMRKNKPNPDDASDDIERHSNGAPKVILGARVVLPEETSTNVDLNGVVNPVVHVAPESLTVEQQEDVPEARQVAPIDEDDLPDLDEKDDAPLSTPMLDARFNKALGGLSAESLDLTLLDRAPAQPVIEPVATGDHVVTQSSEPISETANLIVSKDVSGPAKTNFFNYNFKTQQQQWRELGLNVSVMVASVAKAKAEAAQAVQVPEEVLEVETAATPTLDMNVPQFLNQFSHNLPEPTFTSVDYEDLLDRTRLQAWLNTHTVDQILLFAQDAHDARYDDVAQLMLNDVLLRGNAEQCAAVLNLRYLWSYPQGVY